VTLKVLGDASGLGPDGFMILPCVQYCTYIQGLINERWAVWGMLFATGVRRDCCSLFYAKTRVNGKRSPSLPSCPSSFGLPARDPTQHSISPVFSGKRGRPGLGDQLGFSPTTITSTTREGYIIHSLRTKTDTCLTINLNIVNYS
jgi:hypothetical protein